MGYLSASGDMFGLSQRGGFLRHPVKRPRALRTVASNKEFSGPDVCGWSWRDPGGALPSRSLRENVDGTPVCPCARQFWLSQLVFRGVSQPVSHSSPRAGPREPRNSDLEVIEVATKGQPKSRPQGTEGAEPSGGLCPCRRDCQPLRLRESFLEKKTLKSGDRAEGRNLPAAESIPVAPA